MTAAGFPRAALFDLDGTLLDSAPDMLATANRMRTARGVGPMTLDVLRPHVSKGARAMLAAAFPELEQGPREALVPEFLAIYQEELGRHSVLFDGVAEMLAALEAAGSTWGIVTNKPEYLARDILPQLGWEARCAVLIGGDTLAEKKPHPLPLQVAAERIGIAIADCVYVGDDERDIQSARAAGMPSIAALWGYRQVHEDPAQWQADVMVELPATLIEPSAWPAARHVVGAT
ncbi:phosphoglycolate phosphatase [Pseudoxanthomonas sp. Root630]|uniref:phosphoglycolate phosphatase n=1 Tax=Pseudoxanthomonas sp. Root630 TaxID=1736574 RepID=UPI0007031E92|nr:phosphoglycolate phosphatase [Pseudoxanthomonas sp. Root630]KRA44443.1 phosphoglycolate phosphatase [Pseudoxanthomonas sp. Root630]